MRWTWRSRPTNGELISLDAPRGPALPDHEIHVWWTLDVRALAPLGGHLVAGERERASRFLQLVDRERFVARRGLLRSVLARYLGVGPGAVRLSYGPYGKPALDTATAGLEFNLAHSGDAALLAVTRGKPVGIDIEWVRHDIDAAALATRVCTPRERAVLGALPPHRRRDAFFTFWVHKEAIAKADGRGLSLSPSDIDVADAVAHGRTCVVTPSAETIDVTWRSRSLSVTLGLNAAVAVPDIPWLIESMVYFNISQ